MPASSLDQIVSLCKRRGFIFPGSEIYGGLANSWDYGPLGVELKNAIQQWWWERFVTKRQDMVGVDAAIFMNPKVWEASGHVANFNDALVDCKECKARHRADHLIEDADPDMKADGKSPQELTKIIQNMNLGCPTCGNKGTFTNARTFNLLFQTQLGALEEGDHRSIYLRGEIAQAMFVNFKNVLNTMRKRLPFGVASVGKAFRNEITPGNFTFRTLEFDLMEFEYFIEKNNWEEMFTYWQNEQQAWLKEMGFANERLRIREHTQDELSHYSKKTVDVEYQTPFGWKELFGLAYRTDFDLKNHMEQSGEDLQYTNPDTGEKFIPHVIEPTFGLSRLTLMTLLEAYNEETLEGEDTRTVMKFNSRIAPVQAAILPLSKKEPLIAKAQEIYNLLNDQTNLRLDFDMTGSIGKRYRRQDEIGTPKCITIDFGTIGEDSEQGEKNTVTVRDRDTLQQERLPIEKLRDISLA
ncbi:glycine--tRNA ligase [Candidatus Peregrinibacteria bacterium CG10_big_fil_rev_8_21_14_0_10_49_16]|nr:MAG: glycine--tRNA ligase [Candidatus Peregrinibacteria bacterium CG22_combo_CG10-13_8_21_14_all_49_11]PIR52335.1 MAG: glycine--tRNA ligase [Candidatus Peregrinibacteria bacterium CG10_big_fil_rev_8_21_14_0_10_49_16]